MASITVTVFKIGDHFLNGCERSIDCSKAVFINQINYTAPEPPVACDDEFAEGVPAEVISYDGQVWIIAKTTNGLFKDCIA